MLKMPAAKRAGTAKRRQLERLLATMRRLQASDPVAFRALVRLANMVEKNSTK
jgi:hypothetical protein